MPLARKVFSGGGTKTSMNVMHDVSRQCLFEREWCRNDYDSSMPEFSDYRITDIQIQMPSVCVSIRNDLVAGIYLQGQRM